MLVEWLVRIAAPIIVFGAVVFVHELGHFLAAKAVGVYAPRFSIGFGPALWRRRRGETEYVLAALPLGGYVRMASREDEATAFLEGGSEKSPPIGTVGGDGTAKLAQEEYPEGYDPEAMVPFGPKPVPENRWFESKPLWARLVILLAGVTMNVVLTLVLTISLVAFYGSPVPATRVVGSVADTTAAGRALAGAILPGDTIRSIDGQPVNRWGDIASGIRTGDGDSVRIETQRGVVAVPVAVGGADAGAAREELVGTIAPAARVVLGQATRGSPAQRAGLEPGDTVLAVDGAPVHSPTGLIEVISGAPGRTLRLDVQRAGARREILVRPDSVTDESGGASSVRGRIGIQVAADYETARERRPFAAAVSEGWRWTWLMGGLIFQTLRDIGTGDVSLGELGGPGTIAVASAQAAVGGLERFLGLIALLSINVAIFNLLPIPLLDGGQILINVIESAKGSAFSPRTREYILRAGLLAIALLFAIVIFNDTSRIVGLVRGIWD